jgi:methyl-accepting chemotaxis protein
MALAQQISDEQSRPARRDLFAAMKALGTHIAGRWTARSPTPTPPIAPA